MSIHQTVIQSLVWANDCQYNLPGNKQTERCNECSTLCKTLTTQVHRFNKWNSEATTSNHISYRYKILLILFVFLILVYYVWTGTSHYLVWFPILVVYRRSVIQLKSD